MGRRRFLGIIASRRRYFRVGTTQTPCVTTTTLVPSFLRKETPESKSHL